MAKKTNKKFDLNKIKEEIKTTDFKKTIKENKGFIFSLIVLIAIFFIKLPYIVYTPGNLTDVSKRINSTNFSVSTGSYNLTSVRVVSPNIPFVLLSKILPGWDAVPIKKVVLENETIEDMESRDRLYYDEAISNAKIVALKAANIPHEIIDSKNIVAYLTKEHKGNLKINDEILLVDGYRINEINSLIEYIESLAVGQKVEFKIKRDGKEMNIPVNTYLSEGKVKVGVMIITTFEIKNDIDLFVDKGKRESGPSGGLITSLAIFDAITPGDLTKGRKIAGTGTIDINGKVDEVGGIKYKLGGAEKNNADIFLVPKANLKEALDLQKKHNYKIKIYGISDLNEAIDVLRNN